MEETSRQGRRANSAGEAMETRREEATSKGNMISDLRSLILLYATKKQKKHRNMAPLATRS